VQKKKKKKKKKKINHTEEQQEIVRFFSGDWPADHLLVNARAGAGKTTTTTEVARVVQGDTLFLTFSCALKLTARENSDHRAESFHSAVQNLFGVPCIDTASMEKFLQENKHCEPVVDLGTTKLLVVDECQDLTPNYVALIQKIQVHLHRDHRLLMVGDRFQNIFQSLQNSSTRYMDEPHQYFGGQFQRRSLNTSFRLTSEIISWVNSKMDPRKIPGPTREILVHDWGTGLKPHPKRGRVDPSPVITCEVDFSYQELPQDVVQTIRDAVAECGVESVLVLVPSCRFGRHHPAARLMQQVRGNWVVMDTEFRDDPRLLMKRGKVATAYKMKGKEFDVVVYFGFDSGLEKISGSTLLAHSVAYVSATRAKQLLVVVRDTRNEPFCTLRDADRQAIEPVKRVFVRGTELVKYCPYDRQIDEVKDVQVATLGDIPTVLGPDCFIRQCDEGLWEDTFQLRFNQLRSALKSGRVDPASEITCILYQRTLQLLATVFPRETDLLWEVKIQQGKINHSLDLLVNNHQVVHITCENTYRYTQGQIALIGVCMLGKPEGEAYVLNPKLGEVRQIFCPNIPMEQYLQALLHRKSM
jgi:hypothetical protein